MSDYIPLTQEQKFGDPSRVPSGILKSGELLYLDQTQIEALCVFYPSVSGSIVAQSGLRFASQPITYLSNALDSLNRSITYFTIFNPYIHHIPKLTENSESFNLNGTLDSAFRIQYSGNYSESFDKFNLYSEQYRNSGVKLK
jgi:hypothetical protein